MNIKKIVWHPSVPLALGILSLLVAIYIYRASKVYPELTYFVNPIRVALVRTGQVTDLETLYKRKKVEGNVTIAQIAVWNKGTQPIKPENILESN